MYALVCEGIKYRDVLSQLCLRCGLFAKVCQACAAHRQPVGAATVTPRSTMVVAQVKRNKRAALRLMVYDLLIGTGLRVRIRAD